MRTATIALPLLSVFSTALVAQTATPFVIRDVDPAVVEPYAFNGVLPVGFGVGSASLVGAGLIATAAHVIFNESDLIWPSRNGSRFYRGNHATYSGFTPDVPSVPITAWFKWDSYASRTQTDNSGEGFSSMDTFNLDFAIGYFLTDTYGRYAEFHVDPEGAVSILRDPRDKMIVGYPSDGDFIPAADDGFMHQTAIADYKAFWTPFHSIPQTWRDSENFWVATHDLEDVTTYGGNSGGPVYVRDDLGRWVFAATVVGSDNSSSVVIRAADDAAYTLYAAAQSARLFPELQRVQSLSLIDAAAANTSFSWVDATSGESAFLVLRQFNGTWQQIATLPANSTTFTDASTLPGATYLYQVQPVKADLRGPRSPALRVDTPGANPSLASALNVSALTLQTRGQSSFFADGNRLRSGRVQSMGSSFLELPIIGPGTLSFSWGVSSEANPDFDNPSAPSFRDPYDALFFTGPATPADFLISGNVANESHSISIPAGPTTLRWRYEKDPYSNEGLDAGFLNALSWSPGEDAPAVFGSFAFDSVWHGSAWFGTYAVSTASDWVTHLELGPLFLSKAPNNALFAFSPNPALGTLFTTPAIFPFVFRYQSDSWLFYYRNTGNLLDGAWFFDSATNAPFQL